MQPFARPVARLVLGHSRLGLDRAAWHGKTAFGYGSAVIPSSTICARCSVSAIGCWGRSYSTQLPPKDSNTASSSSPGSETNRKTDPEPIDLLRAESKAEGIKTDEIKLNSTKIEEGKIGGFKPEKIHHDHNDLGHDLPSWAEGRRTKLTQKVSEIMDNLQTRALHATQTLNDITGYTGIEKIKAQNAELETALAEAHEQVRNARLAYKTSNSKRATTQREVTTLLARKDSWSPLDLERFTELYRTDHILENEVASAQESLTEAEAEEQSLNQRLNAGILRRYHEEQIWSDRIRRASTWGTWGLMGMNFVLFVILQFVAEPWKRRRLIKGVVAEETTILEEVRAQLEEVKLALQRHDQPAAVQSMTEAVKAVEDAQTQAVEEPSQSPAAPASVRVEPAVEVPAEAPVDAPATSWIFWQQKLKEAGVDLRQWRVFAEDLYSERRIDLRMRDASLLALQGALAGAALTGSIALLLVRKS